MSNMHHDCLECPRVDERLRSAERIIDKCPNQVAEIYREMKKKADMRYLVMLLVMVLALAGTATGFQFGINEKLSTTQTQTAVIIEQIKQLKEMISK